MAKGQATRPSRVSSTSRLLGVPGRYNHVRTDPPISPWGLVRDPKVPFNLSCEPGATSPVVTPFNGKQHAGIQVVNTAQFPADAGPLSNVHR